MASQEQLLQRLVKEIGQLNKKVDALRSKATWVTAQDLSRLAGGLTGEQLRGIRENYPDWVKPKGDDKQSYLYNWTELALVYPPKAVAA